MIGERARQAYNALRHNRRRSVLTMLGMAWGIATVVLLLAYGAGFERGLMVAFETFSGNLIVVFPGRTSMQAGGSKAGVEIKLTTDDVEWLRNEVPLIKRISPEAAKDATVGYGNRASSFSVDGVMASFAETRHLSTALGTFLDRKSTRLNSSHLVISYAVFCLKKKK